MHRSIAVALTAGLAASVLTVAPGTAADPGGDRNDLGAPVAEQAAEQALAQATDALAGESSGQRGADPSATIALRDLFAAIPRLDAGERKQAGGILARPTQGSDDPQGQGYAAPSRKKCNGRLCVHYVNRTADAPPSRKWVTRNLEVLNRTWKREVGALDYRRPVKDGQRGGNGKFDVYLKELGSQGLYGYCAPEGPRSSTDDWVVTGYCVVDDDFARGQYGVPPIDSLRVTAAHEFFHAIQFAYDFGEDGWFMEATATWMEERVADSVNDNRQYLDYGQVRQPRGPLDFFNNRGFNQYGNWAFFEYLGKSFGNGVVRTIWNKAGAFRGAPDKYSTAAVKLALGREGFSKVFRGYAAANTIPGRTYPEGDQWPSATITRSHSLSPDARTASGSLTIDHMASGNIGIRPDGSVRGSAWRLRVDVNGPDPKTSPMAMVLVHKQTGKVERKVIGLNPDGKGALKFRFNSGSVERATLTLVNASTRFNCWEGRFAYSCQGIPRDNNKRFAYTLRMFRG